MGLKEVVDSLRAPNWPKSRWIVGICIAGTVTAAAATLQPIIVARIVDTLLSGKAVGLMIIAFAVTVGVILSAELVSKYCSAFFVKDLRDKWRHLVLVRAFGARENNQDIVSESNNDIDAVIETYYQGRAHLLLSLVGLGFAAIALTNISPIFLAIVLFCAFAMIIMPLFFRKHIARRKQIALEKTAVWNRLLAETLSGVATLYRRGVLSRRLLRVSNSSMKSTQAALKSETYQGAVDVSIGGVLFLNQLLIILVGWWLVSSGNISVGELVAALQFEEILLIPMLSLTDSLTDIAGGREIGDDLLSKNYASADLPETDSNASSRQRPTQELATQLYPNLRLRVGEFSAPIGDSQFSLHVPTLNVSAGDVVLLSGPSGSGKSVLLQMLIGEVGALSPELSDRFAYIPAEEQAFGDSFDYDVLLDRGCTNLPKLIKNFDSSRARLDEMYRLNSNIGASLGERQRISLLRAAVDNPILWILDEATIHLDIASTKQILANIMSDPMAAAIVVDHGLRKEDFSFTQVWEISVDGNEHILSVHTSN